MADASLHAPYDVAFPFERTVGPLVGTFLAGLRERRLLGVRTARGTVLCPPPEFDPIGGEALHDLIDLPGTGSLTTWTWVATRPGDPVDHDFAWALVALDGAEGTFLHAVDVGGDPSALHAGLRVRPRWAAEPAGVLMDLVCFEPEESA